MHADMEIHSAAKLNMPHLRRDAGTGARSALNSRLCAMSASTSGALVARPEELFMRFSNPIQKAPSTNIQAPEKLQASKLQNRRTRFSWMLKFGASLDVGAWSLVFFSYPNVLAPQLRFGRDEILHHLDALRILQHVHLHATLP